MAVGLAVGLVCDWLVHIRAVSIMKRLPPLSLDAIWWLLPVLLVAWATLLHPLRHLDFWWHLKVGEIIVEQGYIPTTDLFSFTESGKHFVHQNWLAEVVFYVIWKMGGAELLVLFNTLLMVAAFLFIYVVATLRAPYTRLTSFLMLIAAFSFALYSNLRTQTFSFLFLSLFLLIFWKYYFWQNYRLLWLAPIVMVLWVNIHGAYTIGLIVFTIFVGCEIMRYVLLRKEAGSIALQARLRRLIIVFILTFMATFVNPSGIAIYQSVQQVMTDPSSQQFVTEWQTPRITNPEHLLIFFIPFLSATLIFIYSHRKPDLVSCCLFLLFTVLGLTSVRNGIWFAIAVLPVAAWHVSDLSLPLPLAKSAQPALQSRPTQLAAVANWIIMSVLIATTVLFNPWLRPRLGIEALRPSLVDPRIPLEAIEYIDQSRINGRMFHHQDFGDYMIWRLWPQQFTFVDGRVHLFSYQIVQDYLNALGGLGWEDIMDKHHISYIFLPKPSQNEPIPLVTAVQQSPHWQLIYEDKKSVIFQRLSLPKRS